MIATTISQSKHLLELGIDPKTSDMCYVPIVNLEGEYSLSENLWGEELWDDNDDGRFPGWIPAWSLSALLELMPSCVFTIRKKTIRHLYRLVCEKDGRFFETHWHQEPIDAAIELLELLSKYGYLEKETKDETNRK